MASGQLIERVSGSWSSRPRQGHLRAAVNGDEKFAIAAESRDAGWGQEMEGWRGMLWPEIKRSEASHGGADWLVQL